MLNYTFCGMGGLSHEAEKTLWKQGVLCWNDYQRLRRPPFSKEKHSKILADINEAQQQLKNGRAGLCWLMKKLPVSHHCRLYPIIRDCSLYLDIETTGLAANDIITVLSLFNGQSCRTFVRDHTLHNAIRYISPDSIFVTFNGRSFDLPFMRREFSLPLRQINIDLRYVLKGWGITGGLKQAEKFLRIRRIEEPEIRSGRDAIELWRRSQYGDTQALESLCRYNREDVYSLAKIFQVLYNTSMDEHPFHQDI